MRQLIQLAFLFVGWAGTEFVYGHKSSSSSVEMSSHSCAPGFLGDPCGCKESEMLKCIDERAYVIHGYWVGECANGTLCTGSCPYGFCSYNGSTYHILPRTVSDLDEYICGDTRTGVLCGECRDNYSVSYHSYSYACTPNDYCRYGWLLYIVSELLPLIIFFIIVVVFNISFTSGAINSFILFAQLQDTLAIHGGGKIYSSSSHFISISEFVYRFFNFEFFS